jgi:hypothetical protein
VKCSFLIALLPAFLLLAILPACDPSRSASSEFRFFPKAEGVDVFNLAADPYAYKGDITVRGGVMSVEPGKKMFHIVDYREYRACRTVDCAKEFVTVFFGGKLPERMNVVEVTGSVEKNPAGKGGYVLRAKAVRVK